MLIEPENPDEIPPGPWHWETVTPEGAQEAFGTALVAADGRWVLAVDDGYGSADIFSRAVERMLANAWTNRPSTELRREIEQLNVSLEEARDWVRRIVNRYAPDPEELGELPAWVWLDPTNRR